VGATWQEPDGIVVIDYDWCIGCRYCMAACPYWARRFNWSDPEVPAAEVNPNQHYLGNRARKRGVVEKCTVCIPRTRQGRLPACVEACPTGARVFGNLLDPDSEIRWVLANKRVFRLKEDLKTEPRFWYFTD
jgi:molybdopterin-containing oxidoreductase family iron-sulfur binding subunit